MIEHLEGGYVPAPKYVYLSKSPSLCAVIVLQLSVVSIDLPLMQNKCLLAKSTLPSAIALSYNNTTKVFSVDMSLSSKLDGVKHSLLNTPVTMSKDFQMSISIILPLPANEETVSQPVNICNIGSARVLSAPIVVAISCAGIYIGFLAVPNAIQISFCSNNTAT